MIAWHHWLHGCEFEQTLGDSGGLRSMACCSLWGHVSKSDMTLWLNNNFSFHFLRFCFTMLNIYIFWFWSFLNFTKMAMKYILFYVWLICLNIICVKLICIIIYSCEVLFFVKFFCCCCFDSQCLTWHSIYWIYRVYLSILAFTDIWVISIWELLK